MNAALRTKRQTTITPDCSFYSPPRGIAGRSDWRKNNQLAARNQPDIWREAQTTERTILCTGKLNWTDYILKIDRMQAKQILIKYLAIGQAIITTLELLQFNNIFLLQIASARRQRRDLSVIESRLPPAHLSTTHGRSTIYSYTLLTWIFLPLELAYIAFANSLVVVCPSQRVPSWLTYTRVFPGCGPALVATGPV